MNTPPSSFERLVARGWAFAVMEAAHRFVEMRLLVIEALRSTNPEVRSAAVAVLNEANDAEAHDLVVALAQDPDGHVREEVLEYIEQFPRETDAALLLAKLSAGESPFLVSAALVKLFGNTGPLISGEEGDALPEQVRIWEKFLRAKGHVA